VEFEPAIQSTNDLVSVVRRSTFRGPHGGSKKTPDAIAGGLETVVATPAGYLAAA
jgi:hypothetical protein